jgi:hypothetical protein
VPSCAGGWLGRPGLAARALNASPWRHRWHEPADVAMARVVISKSFFMGYLTAA